MPSFPVFYQSYSLDESVAPGSAVRMSVEEILDAMQVDKKRSGARVKYALPVRIGDVKPGIEVSDIELIFR